jgi:hypothetical protein
LSDASAYAVTLSALRLHHLLCIAFFLTLLAEAWNHDKKTGCRLRREPISSE